MALVKVPGKFRWVNEKNLWSMHQVSMAGGINPSSQLKEYYPTRIGKFTDCFIWGIRGTHGDRDGKNYWVRGTNPSGNTVTIAPKEEYFLRDDPYTGTR